MPPTLLLSLDFRTTLNPLVAQVSGQGEVIEIGGLENLLWSVVTTIQYYTIPVMAISIAVLGLQLAISSDDIHAKEKIKSRIIVILIAGFLIFSAATVANFVKSAVVSTG